MSHLFGSHGLVTSLMTEEVRDEGKIPWCIVFGIPSHLPPIQPLDPLGRVSLPIFAWQVEVDLPSILLVPWWGFFERMFCVGHPWCWAHSLEVVMCLAWPQARSQARPGPKKPGRAGPKPSSGHKFWPGFGFPKAQAKPGPGPKAKALRLDRSGYQSACQPRVLDISYRLRVPHSLSPPS